MNHRLTNVCLFATYMLAITVVTLDVFFWAK